MRRASVAAWRVIATSQRATIATTSTPPTTSFTAPLATRLRSHAAADTTALSAASRCRFLTPSAAAARASYCANPMHGYDSSRAGTCEYTDVHYPDPVDVTVPRKMQVADAGYFRDFGGVKRFSGPASTIKCFENNPLVRQALGEPGKGRVLVVDGGGSMRCALLGDNLAGMAVKNGWSGIIINGCLRDSVGRGTNVDWMLCVCVWCRPEREEGKGRHVRARRGACRRGLHPFMQHDIVPPRYVTTVHIVLCLTRHMQNPPASSPSNPIATRDLASAYQPLRDGGYRDDASRGEGHRAAPGEELQERRGHEAGPTQSIHTTFT